MIPLIGGQSSLQISSPGEEQRVAAAPRRRLEKRLLFWGFCVGIINRAKVGHQGTWDQARRAGGAARGLAAPGTLLAAPWLPCGPLWTCGSFRNADFYIF